MLCLARPLSGDRIKPNDGFETKESIFEHALRGNEENDALFTFACMFSPISLRVRNAALDSVRTRFRKSPELAISGLPIVSLALASIEKNFLVSPPAQDVALATLRGLKAAASSASHPLSANAALRTLLPIVEHIDNEEDEERSLALDLVLLAEAWISAPFQWESAFVSLPTSYRARNSESYLRRNVSWGKYYVGSFKS